MAELRERLGRLRVPRTDLPPSELDRLERALHVDGCDGAPLKQRLERLVAVAARGRARDGMPAGSDERRFEPFRAASAPRPRARVEELINGSRVENERGEFFRVETDVHLDSFHGDVSLSRFRTVSPTSAAILSGEPGLSDFALDQAVFLDTETTGLAGGTGTAAFLVGLGWVDGDRFRVEQLFMRDYHEEAAMLRGMAERLARFRNVVTFNGRLFDMPLLEARCRLSRERFPLEAAPHLDLLHPARRLWKARLESCRLQVLERRLLGLARRGDVAGEEIPRLYFDYVRGRDARALAGVFEHNRLDIVSLAALAVHACGWVEESRAEHPLDIVSLARVLERAALGARSQAEYRRALDGGNATARLGALVALASCAKRSGDHDGALRLWELAAAEGDGRALREVAMHHEHRRRDYGAALAVVERCLGNRCGALPGDPRVAADLARRRDRLLRKMRQSAGPAGQPASLSGPGARRSRPAGSPRGPGSRRAS